MYTPPPRPKKNQPILWNAVRTNELQAISTDHCAYTLEQKALGKDDFRQIPNGAVGMENRLHMIHYFGVREGRISLNRMVELLCTNPAKLFGMYPKKGTIAVGCDADIVVFDPEKRRPSPRRPTTRATDINIFEGTEVRLAGDRAAARRGDRRGRRAAREAGERRVRPPGEVRRGAPAGDALASYRVCGKPRSTFDVAGSGQRDVTTFVRV